MLLALPALLARRLAGARDAMASAGCDALLVTRRANIFYLTNFAGSSGVVLLTPSEVFLLLDSRYTTEAGELIASGRAAPAVTLVPVESSYDESTVAVIGDAAGNTVGFEAEDVSYARHAWLQGHVPAGHRLEATRGLVERLREVKDGHEIEVLRAAARTLARIADTLGRAVVAGRRERDVADAIDAAMRSSSFSRPAFDTIVASGPNGALPHATAGDRIIESGDLVVVDFGGVRDGYCVDMSRTLLVPSPGGEASRLHAAVLAAQRAAIAAVRPGASPADIDGAARAALEAAGYPDAYGHATGHGLGIELHEAPRISRRRTPDDEPAHVRPGMVFTIEPGAYVPGWGGVRIEDDVLVTEDGCEVLTMLL